MMTFSEFMADREFRAKATALTGCKSGELIVAGALTGAADAAAALTPRLETA
jgi:hypothetical protein